MQPLPGHQSDAGDGGRALLLHEDVTFSDTTVLTEGHAFVRCTFRRCTFVITAVGGSVFDSCTFDGPATIRLELTLSDQVSWSSLEGLMNTFKQLLLDPDQVRRQ